MYTENFIKFETRYSSVQPTDEPKPLLSSSSWFHVIFAFVSQRERTAMVPSSMHHLRTFRTYSNPDKLQADTLIERQELTYNSVRPEGMQKNTPGQEIQTCFFRGTSSDSTHYPHASYYWKPSLQTAGRRTERQRQGWASGPWASCTRSS